MDFGARHYSFRPGEPCVVIGEIGVNHNRDQSILFKLIDEGIRAGIDIIKLQRFKAAEEISIFAETAEYQRRSGAGNNQLKMAEELELPDPLLIQAAKYCRDQSIGFFCTAFDHESVDFVADELLCKTIKVPSPEITNRPLIEHMARRFPALIISTGASDLAECTRTLDWIKGVGDRELAFMHCTSQYPTPINQANLRAIQSMRAALNVPVGYSDHTRGILAGIVATSLGAAMLEKHYTLDRSLPGPDHQASADINELGDLVSAVRECFESLGDGLKVPVQAEKENMMLIRKSVTCALSSIEAGTVIQAAMLGVKRPRKLGAVEPFELSKIVGLTIRKAKAFDEPILWSDFT